MSCQVTETRHKGKVLKQIATCYGMAGTIVMKAEPSDSACWRMTQVLDLECLHLHAFIQYLHYTCMYHVCMNECSIRPFTLVPGSRWHKRRRKDHETNESPVSSDLEYILPASRYWDYKEAKKMDEYMTDSLLC